MKWKYSKFKNKKNMFNICTYLFVTFPFQLNCNAFSNPNLYFLSRQCLQCADIDQGIQRRTSSCQPICLRRISHPFATKSSQWERDPPTCPVGLSSFSYKPVTVSLILYLHFLVLHSLKDQQAERLFVWWI